MTSNQLNRVCVVGAGAIGGWIGAQLAAAGCELSMVARGATLQALLLHGLRLQVPVGAEPVDAQSAAPGSLRTQVHTVQASSDPTALGVQDLVVIAVKAPALLQVARGIAPLIGPDTVVLPAMNGVPWWFFQGFGGGFSGTRLLSVDPSGEIGAAIGAEHVIGCVVHASCTQVEPGLVRHYFGKRLIIGEPSGQKTRRVLQLAALLQGAGFEAVVSEQIQMDTWYKLWGNMTVNPVSAITGATTDLILDDDLVRHFISGVMLEAREIGARIGIPMDQQPEDRHAVTRRLGAFKTSMLQDVEAGRAVELDALVTVVKELGALTGVPTPQTDTLLGLARLHARVRGLY